MYIYFYFVNNLQEQVHEREIRVCLLRGSSSRRNVLILHDGPSIDADRARDNDDGDDVVVVVDDDYDWSGGTGSGGSSG